MCCIIDNFLLLSLTKKRTKRVVNRFFMWRVTSKVFTVSTCLNSRDNGNICANTCMHDYFNIPVWCIKAWGVLFIVVIIGVYLANRFYVSFLCGVKIYNRTVSWIGLTIYGFRACIKRKGRERVLTYVFKLHEGKIRLKWPWVGEMALFGNMKSCDNLCGL